jgi:hypothetical protein
VNQARAPRTSPNAASAQISPGPAVAPESTAARIAEIGSSDGSEDLADGAGRWDPAPCGPDPELLGAERFDRLAAPPPVEPDFGAAPPDCVSDKIAAPAEPWCSSALRAFPEIEPDDPVWCPALPPPADPGRTSQYWSIPDVPGGAWQVCAADAPGARARPAMTIKAAHAVRTVCLNVLAP